MINAKKLVLLTLIIFFLFCSNVRAQTFLQIKTMGPVDLHVYNSNKQHVGFNYTNGSVNLQIPGTFFYSGPDEDVLVVPGTYNYTPNGIKQMVVIQGDGLAPGGMWDYFTVRITSRENKDYNLTVVSEYNGNIVHNETRTLYGENGTMYYADIAIMNVAGPMNTFVSGPYEFLEVKYPPNNLQTNKANVTVNGTVNDKNIRTVTINSVDVNTVSSDIQDYANFNTTVSLVSGNNTIDIKAKEQSGYDCIKRRNVFSSATGDYTPPAVNIISPTNTTYNTGTVSLEFTIDKAVTWIGFSLNGEANVTISGNTTLMWAAKEGPNNIIVYATDNHGNTGSSQIFFTAKVPWLIKPIPLPEGGLTINSDIYLVLAEITQEGKTITSGIVNFTIDGKNGTLDYLIGNLWGYSSYGNYLNLTEKKSYVLNVTGYKDNASYRGSGTSIIKVGNLNVLINSLYYKANKDFTVSANISLGSNPQPAKASYRIKKFDYTTISTILSGDLDCFGYICNKTVGNLSKFEENGYALFFLEINASNSTIGESGGNYTVLSQWYPSFNLYTDKYTYKPGETIKIKLTSNSPIDDANFTIDSGLQSTPIKFDKIDSMHWTKNYTLSTSVSSGEYEISTNISSDNETYNQNEWFEVKSNYAINVSIDSSYKKPGELMRVNVSSDRIIYESNLSIIRPDGSLETNPLPMTVVNSYVRSKNYTLGLNSVEGTWIIRVKANVEGYIVEKNITFSITAWSLLTYLNKYNFNSSENVSLTINLLEVYDNNLNFSVFANLTDPVGNVSEIYRGSLIGNSIYNVTFTIPENYKNGTSIIRIFINDSYSRSKVNTLYFLTNFIKTSNNSQNSSLITLLTVTPSTSSEVTTIGRTLERTFTLENTGNINILNISTEVGPQLSSIVTVVSKPDIVYANSKSNLTLKIDTNGLGPNTYADFVKIHSSSGNPQIYISIDIIGNISSDAANYLNEVNSLEENVTSLKNQINDSESILTSLDEIKQNLNEAVNYYNSNNFYLAKSKMDTAVSSLSDLKEQIRSMNLTTKNFDYSFIIWIFASAVIISVIGIFFIKYFHKGKGDKANKVIEVYSRRDL